MQFTDSIGFSFDIPEQFGWDMVALVFGSDVAQELRQEWDDLERFENEGGPCVP